jgi:hypothetical protein
VVPRQRDRPYQVALRRALRENGWDVVAIEDDTEWWADQQWVIRSTKQCYGSEFVITFMVDPMFEGADKSRAVWLIVASVDRPIDRQCDGDCVAELYLQKGHYAQNLRVFLNAIDSWRNQQQVRARQ